MDIVAADLRIAFRRYNWSINSRTETRKHRRDCVDGRSVHATDPAHYAIMAVFANSRTRRDRNILDESRGGDLRTGSLWMVFRKTRASHFLFDARLERRW